MNFAVAAKQHELQQTRAFATAFQCALLFAREMFDGGENVGFERDRIGKAPLGEHRGEGKARSNGLLFISHSLVDPAEEILAEASRKRRAGSLEDVGNAF